MLSVLYKAEEEGQGLSSSTHQHAYTVPERTFWVQKLSMLGKAEEVCIQEAARRVVIVCALQSSAGMGLEGEPICSMP